jgi:SAM-dependent methyltransferase
VDATLSAWLAAADGTDEEFVERAWRLVLRREVEPEARVRAVALLQRGDLSRAGLLGDLVASEEFARVRLLDDAVAYAAGVRRVPRAVAGPARPRGLRAPAAEDERAIEIPWCLARYDSEDSVLDVGYAFAEPAYLMGLVALGTRDLVGVDLVEADVPGLRSVVADVRSLPFEDGTFRLAFCISTLEHVGRDNTIYGVESADLGGMNAALRELRRVLARRGRLFVTVPCGQPADRPAFVVDEPDAWRALFRTAGFRIHEDELYARRDERWLAVEALPADVAYGEHSAEAVLCAELRPRGLLRRV